MDQDQDQHVVVTIRPSGKVNVEAMNFQGVGCTEATEQIEIALGSKVDRSYKPEYHESPAQTMAETLNRDF